MKVRNPYVDPINVLQVTLLVLNSPYHPFNEPCTLRTTFNSLYVLLSYLPSNSPLHKITTLRVLGGDYEASSLDQSR